MKKFNLTAIIEKDKDGYCAFCPENFKDAIRKEKRIRKLQKT